MSADPIKNYSQEELGSLLKKMLPTGARFLGYTPLDGLNSGQVPLGVRGSNVEVQYVNIDGSTGLLFYMLNRNGHPEKNGAPANGLENVAPHIAELKLKEALQRPYR